MGTHTDSDWSFKYNQLGVLVKTVGGFVEQTPEHRVVFLHVRERGRLRRFRSQRRLEGLADDTPHGRPRERRAYHGSPEVIQSHCRLMSGRRTRVISKRKIIVGRTE